MTEALPPSGLATIASTWDDSPHARGAIHFCRAAAAAREAAQTRTNAVPDRMIVDHAALVIQAAYRMRDWR